MSTLENRSRITPFLWFDKNAEEAVDFYLGIFPNSRRLSELRNNSRIGSDVVYSVNAQGGVGASYVDREGMVTVNNIYYGQ